MILLKTAVGRARNAAVAIRLPSSPARTVISAATLTMVLALMHLAATAEAVADPAPQDLSIERGLPRLLFGLTAKDVAARFSGAGAPYQVDSDGEPLDLMPLVLDDHALTLHLNNGRVDGFESDDPTLRTTPGAHVGQSLHDVRRLHPDGTLQYSWLEGSVMSYVVRLPDLSVAFLLDHADLALDPPEKVNPKITDQSVLRRKVISLWVTRSSRLQQPRWYRSSVASLIGNRSRRALDHGVFDRPH